MRIKTCGGLVDSAGSIWLPIIDSNGLIIRHNERSIKYIGNIFSEKERDKGKLIVKALEYNGNILFFNREKCEVWIVNKETFSSRKIQYYNKSNDGISDIVQVADEAIIFLRSGNIPVVFLNLNDFSVKAIEYMNNFSRISFIRGIIKDSKVYNATRYLDNVSIWIIDTKKKEMTEKKMDERLINAICCEGDFWYIFALNKKNQTVLRKYDSEFKETLEEDILFELDQIEPSGLIKYFKMEVCDGKAFFIPSLADNVYMYDINNKNGRFIVLPNEIKSMPQIENDFSFADCQKKDGEIYLFPYRFNSPLKIDINEETIHEIPMGIKNIKSEMIRDYISDNDLINENNPVYLLDFLEYIGTQE